ncbi:MAG: metal-dependent hydrolase [Bryobacterales bacterium]|nr:metal-dependent hydrolase [Bryobacterales bacterium]
MRAAGVGRLAPRATAVFLVASNAPDLDIVAGLAGAHVYLDWHRHFTHALLFAPLVALAAVAIVRVAVREPLRWRLLVPAGVAAAVLHDALDWLNIYGIRLWLPFSSRMDRLDITPVVDVWILLALLLSVAAPALSRLVGAEIGESRRGGRYGAVAAAAALVFILAYNAGRAVLHERAVATLASRIYRGEPARRVAAFPDPVWPLRWRGLVELDSRLLLHRVDLLGRFDPEKGEVYYQAPRSPAIEQARRTVPFQSFEAFAAFPLWVELPPGGADGAVEVQLLDLRFGTPREPGFAATARIFPDTGAVRSWFTFGRPRSR